MHLERNEALLATEIGHGLENESFSSITDGDESAIDEINAIPPGIFTRSRPQGPE